MIIRNNEHLIEVLLLNKTSKDIDYYEMANIQIYDNSIDDVSKIERIIKQYNRHDNQLCYITTCNNELYVEKFRDKYIYVVVQSSRMSGLDMAMHICNRSQHKLKFSDVFNDAVLLIFKKDWESNDWK